MAKRTVTFAGDTTCPHCKKAHEVELSQEIAVPVVTLQAEPGEDLPGVSSKLDAIGHKVDDLCTRFPEMCNQVTAVEKKLETLAQPSHPAPTADLLRHWEGCPECKAGWEALQGKIQLEATQGMVPSGKVGEEAEKLGYKKPAAEEKPPSIVAEEKPEPTAADSGEAKAATETEPAESGKGTLAFLHRKH